MIVSMKCSTLLNLKDQVLEDDKRLNKTLFNVLRVKNTQKTMKTNKNCKYCYQLFESRRSNHVYCTTSCKTKASYKRNNYKYISGHYKKQDVEVEESGQLMIPDNVSSQIQSLEDKLATLQESLKPTINAAEIGSAAIGSVTADATIYGLKKLFNPSSLHATKGDIEKLKNRINDLSNLITNIKNF